MKQKTQLFLAVLTVYSKYILIAIPLLANAFDMRQCKIRQKLQSKFLFGKILKTYQPNSLPHLIQKNLTSQRLLYLFFRVVCKVYLFKDQDRLFKRWTERFLIECRKTKTKVITLTNDNRRRQSNEPIRTDAQ